MRGIARSTAAACVWSGRVEMRAAVTVQKNVRSLLDRKVVRVAQQDKQRRAEHFASTRIAVKWRVFRAKQDVARRRAERETEARVQAEEGYGEARTALAIEAAAELLSAVTRLQVGGRNACSCMCTAAYTHGMASACPCPCARARWASRSGWSISRESPPRASCADRLITW